MDAKLDNFREVWAVDFEFSTAPGCRPDPICMVAKELRGGATLRVWQDELKRLTNPPFPMGSNALYVAYYASAEMGCHLSLGWDLPANVLDLYPEFKLLINGLGGGAGLLDALRHHGLPTINTAVKGAMRALAMRGGPWTDGERAALLQYCESDVVALERLVPKMTKGLDVPRALLRGRYMKAAAHMEANGIPIDAAMADLFRRQWRELQLELIKEADQFGIYDGTTFKLARFEDFLAENSIAWPRHPNGRLDLDDKVFRSLENLHPPIAAIRQLRSSLSQMRLKDLTVGPDHRNRYMMSAFRSRTGRNQPSNNMCIFGMSSFLRSLIKPTEGFALAYIDWSQQEFGIAAALSRDENMLAAYLSGDPYLEFAKQAGEAPAHATKRTHGQVRERFKQCALAVLYGGGAGLISQRTGLPEPYAEHLLQLHKRTFSKFWRWSESAVNHASMYGRIHTVFGWECKTGGSLNPRSLSNFPMQANGAEMLRLACCFATENGIKVCAPVHDAILIEAPVDLIDDAVDRTKHWMSEASAAVLGGFRLGTDETIVRYPDRYVDERGAELWDKLCDILANRGILTAGASAGAHL